MKRIMFDVKCIKTYEGDIDNYKFTFKEGSEYKAYKAETGIFVYNPEIDAQLCYDDIFFDDDFNDYFEITKDICALIKDLREEMGAGTEQCKEALKYSTKHANGDFKMSIAFLRAKGLAVATPGLTFDQRVMRFYENEKIADVSQRDKTVSEKTELYLVSYHREPDCVDVYTTADGRKFMRGGSVKVKADSDYAYLKGHILKMRMAPNDESDNEGMNIHCCFDFPEEGSEGYKSLEMLLKIWSGLDSIDEIALDEVIMQEDELEPIPE
jgi:hypothetical protein